MDPVVVTLQIVPLQRSVDLELPSETPLAKLVPVIAGISGLPVTDRFGKPAHYELFLFRHGQTTPLPEQTSLGRAGVLTGDTLTMTGQGSSIASPLPTPSNASLLECPSGKLIALDNFGKSELLVGRFDARTGRYPDIELSDEPGGNTVSRAHAVLHQRDAVWYVTHLAADNIAVLQDTPLVVQRPYRLQNDNELVLGSVRLIFRTAT